MESSSDSFVYLPKAFFKHDKVLDSELIDHLLAMTPNARGTKRRLIKELLPGGKTDAAQAFKEILIDPRLLSRWFDQETFKVGSLCRLVKAYGISHNQDLKHEVLVARGFIKPLKNAIGRYAFRLENIDILINILKTHKGQHKALSLHLWSMVMEARQAAIRYPNEESYTLFEECLRKALTEHGLNEILTFIEPASIELKKNEIVKAGESGKCKKPAPASEVSDVEQALISEHKARSALLRKIENRINEFRQNTRSFTSKVNALNYDKSLPEAFSLLSIQIDSLDREAKKLIIDVNDYVGKLEADISQKSELLGFCLLAPSIELNFEKPTAWAQELEARSDVLLKLETVLLGVSESEIEAWKAQSPEELRLCKVDELVDLSKNKIFELRERKEASDCYSKFENIVRSKFQDLSWVAFEDEEITPQIWRGVIKYWENVPQAHPLVGIATYRDYSGNKQALAQLLSKSLDSDGELRACLDVLSCLNAGQLENLARDYAELRIPICLALLEGVFSTIEARAYAFEFWSVYPLSESYVANTSHAAKEFFSALYSLASIENTPLNYQSLKLSISAAKSTRVDNRAQALAELKSQLAEALQYRRKGGGVTYVQIWEAAYAGMLKPLLDIYTSFGVQEFFKAYQQWQASFDIDKSIEGWKSGIPEHLKKNSVYDKFIRTQVQLKLGELGLLEEVYNNLVSPRRKRKDAFQILKESIGLVFKSHDKESCLLKAWLSEKAGDARSSFNPYMSTSRSLLPLNDNFLLDNVSVYFPRVFISINLKRTSYKEIYSDLIAKAIDLNSPETLIGIYLKEEVVEGFTRIMSDGVIAIPPDLERLAERKAEEITAAVEANIDELSSYLPIDREGKLKAITQKAHELLQVGLVRQARKVLENAPEVIVKLKSNELERDAKNRVIEKLKQIQDSNYDESLSAAMLESHYHNRLKEYADRRKHILVLQRLLKVQERSVAERVSECLVGLESIDRYPDAATSEYVALYWEQAVDPLLSELVRSKTLLPQYVDKLHQLANIFCDCLKEDFDVVSENSKLNQALLSTAEDWARLPDQGADAADRIIEKFKAHALVSLRDEVGNSSTVEQVDIVNFPILESLFSSPDTVASESLMDLAREWASARPSSISTTTELVKAIESHNWDFVQEVSSARLTQSNFASQEDLENWVISSALLEGSQLGIFAWAHALSFITSRSLSSVARYLFNDRSARAVVEKLSVSFLMAMATNSGWTGSNAELSAPKIIECIQFMLDHIDRAIKNKDFFQVGYSAPNADSYVLKQLWEKFSGGQRQAEARALFMMLAWKMRSPETLAFCLTQAPIELDKRKSQAIAMAADQALASGNTNLLQAFIDLRTSISARPFHLLVDHMTRSVIDQSELPAKLALASNLEKHSDNIYRVSLSIEPRRIDSPDSLVLKLPSNAPVRFAGGATSLELNGPFLSSISIVVAFELLKQSAYSFELEVSCTSHSITGKISGYNQTLKFVLRGSQAFSPLTSDEIDDAFDYFPANFMRGDNYVPRVVDEQKIEKALFKSKTVRSLWITSPRRSGKTSMLFRILDAFSHKVGRDNLVVYLTLDENFSSVSGFNKWIWRRMRTISHNAELRALYSDFDSIGRSLTFDSDTGTFIGALSDQLLSKWNQATRIIFLFDEIDRFAGMYLQGGKERETAINVLWQIRNAIADRRDIGIVFAGSSAAKQLFISRAESPFYNGIDHLELTPFSTKTKLQEECSRQIVEPTKTKEVYSLPKETLDHIIWVCAGIPYYMKLISGATLARAKQSYLLISDVNEGLRALLSRETGIGKLDDMGGEPGSDDLRTIVGIEKGSDGILAKAVLYAFADLHSPLSGNRTYRGKITSSESRLVSVYKIPKPLIERGLELCIDLGLIKIVHGDSVPELDFVIPLLGESIRKASQRLWATIDHELINLSGAGEML